MVSARIGAVGCLVVVIATGLQHRVAEGGEGAEQTAAPVPAETGPVTILKGITAPSETSAMSFCKIVRVVVEERAKMRNTAVDNRPLLVTYPIYYVWNQNQEKKVAVTVALKATGDVRERAKERMNTQNLTVQIVPASPPTTLTIQGTPGAIFARRTG